MMTPFESAVRGSLEESRGGRTHVHYRNDLGDRATPLSGTQLDDAAIKPDRMVMRWLATNGAGVKNPEEARDVLAQVAQTLQGQYTLWEIDHAIWRARQPSRTRAAK